MRRALCDSLPRASGQWVEIPETEARHLISVLRLGPGDEVELLDGRGLTAKARLEFRGKAPGATLIGNPLGDPRRLSFPVHLALSILKGEAMEWAIEKAVELGVRSLTPLETEFTVVNIRKKGAENFQERWQRIADQALKQCGRLDRMEIRPARDIEAALSEKEPLFWLDEDLAANGAPELHLGAVASALPEGSEIRLLIGPEGGLSPSEKSRLLQLTGGENRAIKRVHLGSLILRAETAALAGAAILIGQHYGKRTNSIQTPA
jgi:16S rRNA (uracil1498-N3)-methyltransferase